MQAIYIYSNSITRSHSAGIAILKLDTSMAVSTKAPTGL